MSSALRVIVVGAGLAGLSCAFQLSRRGHRVKLLEARDRLGGRVLTLRDWDGDYLAEGGAEFIDSHHRHLIRYARYFGLSLQRLGLWEQLPKDRPGVERFWASLRELSRSVTSPRKPWPFSEELEALDQVSVREWCQRLGLDETSKSELESWCWGTECADPSKVSILGLIMEQRQRPDNCEHAAYTLEGGLDRLVQCLWNEAANYGAELQLGCPVSGLKQTPHEAVVRTECGREYEADRVVLTLPTPVLRELSISPSLSLLKREALEASTHGDQMKPQLEFAERFWGTEKPLARVVGGEMNALWEATRSSSQGILTLWVSGASIQELRGCSENERLSWAVSRVEELYPGSASLYSRGRSIHWGGEPYSRGSYSHFQLGFLTRHARHLPTPEGRLHFAGEHTSPFCGYMEGALESGVRAALEILKLSS